MRTTIALLLGTTITILSGLSRPAFGQDREKDKEKPPAAELKPTHANIKYGPHERNVLDLYLPKASSGKEPTPLVLYIHGGGFRGGDKRSLNAKEGKSYLDAGFAVAAINYRLTDVAPMPAAYLDCARALQYLRHHAKKWS